MKIIYAYITREILKYAAIVLVTVVAIYVAVDFFERIDNFLEAGLPVTRTLVYLAYKIPFIIGQILPVCVLLAVLITFGLMAKNNEIIALKSGGVSIYALLKPLAAIGLGFSLFLFLFSEVAIPLSSAEANRIWHQEVKKRSAVVSKEKNIWLKDNRRMTHIRYYNKAEQAVFGITLFEFDDAFRMARRMDARKGIFTDEGWMLYGVMEQILDPKTGDYSVVFHEEQTESLDLSPESLETVVKKSEEMSFGELSDYVKRVEDEGYDATFYKVDLYAKVAFPFVCLILSVTALGIASKARFREGLALGVSLGIGIAFLYWIFYSFCISLGYGGVLPPVAAAWTANLVFSCFGVFNLLNVE